MVGWDGCRPCGRRDTNGGAVYFYALIGKLFRGCEVFSDCMVAVSISSMVVFFMVCGAIMLRDILKGD